MKTFLFKLIQKSFCMFVLLFLLNNELLQAQNWPQPGATWEYCTLTMTLPQHLQNGSLAYSYIGDTILQDVEYAVISLTFINSSPIPNGSLSEYDLYVRTSNDTIFRYITGSEHILFVNGLEIGDSFNTFRTSTNDYQEYSCQELMNLEVIDIVETVVSGSTLRYVYMVDTEFANIYETSDWVNNGEGMYHLFIENVGFGGKLTYSSSATASDFAYSFSLAGSGSCWLSTDGSDYTLNKYWDNATLLDFNQCLSVAVDEIPEAQLSIYPNPSSDVVYLQLKQTANHPIIYAVFDLSGRIVKNGTITNTTQPVVDVRNLSSGSYVIQIQTNDQSNISRLVKN